MTFNLEQTVRQCFYRGRVRRDESDYRGWCRSNRRPFVGLTPGRTFFSIHIDTDPCYPFTMTQEATDRLFEEMHPLLERGSSVAGGRGHVGAYRIRLSHEPEAVAIFLRAAASAPVTTEAEVLAFWLDEVN